MISQSTIRTIKKFLLEISRYILAFTFLFSSIMKGIDPVGSAIKINEYLESFGLSFFSPWSLGFAFLLDSVEFILGIMLLFGIYRKFATRLCVVLMSLMTALTLYILIKKPVADCGCFGDAIHISNTATFAKNCVLIVLSIFVMKWRLNLTSFAFKRYRWIPVVFSFWIFIYFVYTNYRLLPIKDFRPYKVGTNLIKNSHSDKDNPIIYFKYKKGKEMKIFDMNSLPDSTWTYVDRVEENHSTQQTSLSSSTYDFILMNQMGDNVTDEILHNNHLTFLLCTPQWNISDDEEYAIYNKLYQKCHEMGIRFYGVSGSSEKKIANDWVNQTNASYPLLSMDPTTIKTLIRSWPGLVIIKNGIILDKVGQGGFPSIDKIEPFIKQCQTGNFTYPLYEKWRIIPFGFILLIWLYSLSYTSLRFLRLNKRKR